MPHKITFDSADPMLAATPGTDLENVGIQYIYFHGTQTNASHNDPLKTENCIDLDTDCFNLEIAHCYFDHTSGFAISIGSATYINGKRCFIHHNAFYNARSGIGTNVMNAIVTDNILIQVLNTASGEGIDINNTDTADPYFGNTDAKSVVANNIVMGFPADGIDVSGSEAIIVIGNYIYGDPDVTQTFGISANGAQHIVKGNYIEYVYDGIRIGSNCVVSGNYIKEYSNYGIDCAVSGSYANMSIINNIIEEDSLTGVRGINATGLSDSVIKGNIILNIKADGIMMATANRLVIEGNVLCANADTAVELIKGSATNTKISNNILIGAVIETVNSGAGIIQFGNNNIIDGNMFSQLNQAIYPYTDETDNITVTNNLFIDDNYGLYCRDSAVTFKNYTISGNQFIDIVTCAINGGTQLYNVIISGNKFTTCAIDIFVNRTTDQDGLIYGNNGLGITIENSGTATVLNTTTSIAVAHGLSVTPTRVWVTPRENPTNAVSFWWVDTVGAANFTINVNADPGASNLDFDWHAQVGEG